MSEWRDVAHFLYGRGFWYADPIKEICGLTEEQLTWVPAPHSLCLLWHVGHIAHRERLHIGVFLQGLPGSILPAKYDVFGADWCSAVEVRQSIDSVESVLEWVREVRRQSHAYIASLGENDFHSTPPAAENGLSVAHWLFITACHTALHIGRIQFLRAMIEGKPERAC